MYQCILMNILYDSTDKLVQFLLVFQAYWQAKQYEHTVQPPLHINPLNDDLWDSIKNLAQWKTC